MIITLEGAPAVGKTATAKYLAAHHGFFRVAEVNELFPDRPAPEPKYWYCERQVERCDIASMNQNSVLDGDPFQAAWFCWLYPDCGFPNWSNHMKYFMDNAGAITVPSFYAHMHISSNERARRMNERETARGLNKEQVLSKCAGYEDFPAPLQALFDAMATEFPGWVMSIETTDLDQVAEKLLSMRPTAPPEPEDFVRWLTGWLGRNNPNDFR